MKYRITNEQLISSYDFPSIDFPKYTSQLINWANQNAQATRPRCVGQMSDLFPQFRSESENTSVEGWEEWYTERFPNSIDEATDKVYDMVLKLKDAIQLIDRDLVKAWVKDLIINKTYQGLYFQKVVLQSIAERTSSSEVEGYAVAEPSLIDTYNNQTTWRLANPREEAQGIDGFVGDKPYSVKPESYKTMGRLPEQINVTMAYYKINTKGDLIIEVDD